jgi:hypothetical protein
VAVVAVVTVLAVLAVARMFSCFLLDLTRPATSFLSKEKHVHCARGVCPAAGKAVIQTPSFHCLYHLRYAHEQPTPDRESGRPILVTCRSFGRRRRVDYATEPHLTRSFVSPGFARIETDKAFTSVCARILSDTAPKRWVGRVGDGQHDG